MNTDPANPRPKLPPHLLPLLAGVAVVSLVLMGLYGLVMQALGPSLSAWSTALIAIVFGLLVIGANEILFFGRLRALNHQAQHEAGQALRESEARFRELFEESPISLWEQDFAAVKQRIQELRQQGVQDFRTFFENNPQEVSQCVALIKVLRFNHASLELYAANDRSEMLSSIDQLVPAEGYQLFIEELVWIAEGRTSFAWEGVNRTLRGEIINIRLHWTAAPGFEESLARVLVSIENITASKRAEAALRESEERFRSTFEQAAVGLAHVAIEGHFLRVNQKLCQITGYSDQELLALTFQDITHPDDLQADLGFIQQMLAGERKTYSMEKRYYRKDGSLVWVNLTAALVRQPGGEPKYFISVIEDISLRKEAEAALHNSEMRYRAVSELASDFAFAMQVNPHAGLHTEWVTDAFQRITGYSAAEFGQYSDWLNLVHPSDRPVVEDSLQRLRSGAPVTMQMRIQARDGQVRWVRLQLRPELEPAGSEAEKPHIGRVLGTGQDISEYKRIESEMLHAERLTAMGQMTATLAHEIKNPLQAIRSGLELLNDFQLEADERQEMLEICQREVQRLQSITQNVLNLSRSGQDAYGLVSIPQACRETLDLLSQQIQNSAIQVELILPEDLPPIYGSYDQFVQLLLNLGLNSIECMSNGGRLEIAGQVQGQDLVVNISNDGPAIPSEHLPHLFEPFFTTKPNGTGLGLFICHNIVEQHGGTLEVSNLPDETGVQFTITLPYKPETP